MKKPLSDEQIDAKISEANAFLKGSFCKARLQRRGGKLYLRATLPARPESKRINPYQQVVATGLICNERGIKAARVDAVKLSDALETKTFSWENYRSRVNTPKRTVGDWVGKFEKDYLSKNKITDRSWEGGWLAYFRKLPEGKPLSEKLLIKTVLSTEPDSAQRKIITSRFQSLADFAGLEIDLSRYKGSYGRSSAKKIDLPTDVELEKWFGNSGLITSDVWRRLAGVIAAYGLRPHEVFFSKLTRNENGTLVCNVTKGKTGPRIIDPFYPEWPDRWNLAGGPLHDLSPEEAEKIYQGNGLGAYVYRKLCLKYKFPYRPYSVRHAYAVRAHNIFNLPANVGAMLMGHGPDVHLSNYQKYMTRAVADEAIARAVSSADRAMPPEAT
ncbi:MAG: hypothetical protein AAF151_21435 [Cyanobacteria bacterium J06656_5]